MEDARVGDVLLFVERHSCAHIVSVLRCQPDPEFWSACNVHLGRLPGDHGKLLNQKEVNPLHVCPDCSDKAEGAAIAYWSRKERENILHRLQAMGFDAEHGGQGVTIPYEDVREIISRLSRSPSS
jgi:hypothetical protein